MRVADLLILVPIAFSLPLMRMRLTITFYLALAFFELYSISVLSSLFVFDIAAPSNSFFFKYAISILLTWVLVNIRLSPRGVKRIARVLFFFCFMLIAYTFFYVFLWVRGSVSVRVSFPFTNAPDPGGGGDPHLYAVVLSTCLIVYLFYPRQLTTGRKIMSILVLLLIAIGALAFTFIRVRAIDNEMLTRLTSRALTFDPRTDVSISSRITKTTDVSKHIFLGPILVGIGMQRTEHVWFDVGYASALFSTGLLGLVTVLLCILFFLRRQKEAAWKSFTIPAYQALEYLFINFLACAIGSEFYLVTRGLVPFAIFTAVFVHMIRDGNAPQWGLSRTPVALPLEAPR